MKKKKTPGTSIQSKNPCIIIADLVDGNLNTKIQSIAQYVQMPPQISKKYVDTIKMEPNLLPPQLDCERCDPIAVFDAKSVALILSSSFLNEVAPSLLSRKEFFFVASSLIEENANEVYRKQRPNK